MPVQKKAKEVQFQKFRKWYLVPKDRREPRYAKEICAQLDISREIIRRWMKEIDKELKPPDEYDELVGQAKKQALRMNATSKDLEIYAKLKGFMDRAKQDENGGIKLSADDYYRILQEARSRIADTIGGLGKSGRMGSLPDESGLLPEEVCLHSDEGETAEKDKVATLAIPS